MFITLNIKRWFTEGLWKVFKHPQHCWSSGQAPRSSQEVAMVVRWPPWHASISTDSLSPTKLLMSEDSIADGHSPETNSLCGGAQLDTSGIFLKTLRFYQHMSSAILRPALGNCLSRGWTWCSPEVPFDTDSSVIQWHSCSFTRSVYFQSISCNCFVITTLCSSTSLW